MKSTGAAFTAVIALLLLAALPARAADEPEAVYAKYHRAAMAGDLDEMLNHGLAKRRAEMQGMSAAHRQAALKMAQFMMPRAFSLERNAVHSNGRATLVVSGPGDSGGGRLETIYGTVRMVAEGGNWKVDEASWSNEKPAILGTPKPAPQPAVQRATQKAATSTTGAPVVGSMSSQREAGSRLGAAKAECVYKPVMTAQDMENCR